jgi:hypothetical protein
LLRLQHSLLHLYSERIVRSFKAWHETEDNTFLNRSVPIQKAELLLLEAIDLSERTPKTGTYDLCSFELLRKQYRQLDEDSKLESLLARIENKFHAVKDPILQYLAISQTRDKLFTLKTALAGS